MYNTWFVLGRTRPKSGTPEKNYLNYQATALGLLAEILVPEHLPD